MNTFGGMTTGEWVTSISALLAAIFAVISAADPNDVLSKPDLQTAITSAFVASIPILIAVWAALHAHATATNAVIKANDKTSG